MNNIFHIMRNPQQYLQNMMQSKGMNSPILKNAMDMGVKGDFKSAERLARNICRERGIDPDQAVQNLMKQFHK